jgi:hypothetical protein
LDDVVLEASDDRYMELVNHAECVVAVRLGGHDDAQRDKVVDLLKLQVFLVHLFPYARGVLHPVADLHD